ncbi:hypothetical protein [Streptomyces cinnamoneus]|uniref:hypothetical protein n=1 Tax=Streptomyces cinnamoneus TaxID=53446 RepID=UPI0037A329EF
MPAWQGAVLAVATVVPFAVGTLWFCLHAPSVADVDLQLAGGADEARRVVGARAGDFRQSLRADYVFLAGYTLSLVSAFVLSRRTIARHRGLKDVTVLGVWAAAVAGACDVAENLLLGQGLRQLARARDLPFALATGCATVKWLLLGLAAPVAVVAVALTFKRAVLHRFTDDAPAARRTAVRGADGTEEAERPEVIPPWPVMRSDGERWPKAHRRQSPPRSSGTRWLDGSRVPPGREQGELGFCVSGGGIRSACVCLGALQALRGRLREARYLVSVSGGGYTAGALQLALTGSADGRIPAPPGVTPANVFQPGSPEEDHLRRHSKYVAEGTGQWLTALGVLLRGLLASLSLLVATVTVLGIALSWAYHLVPLTDLSSLAGPGLRFPPHGTPPGLPAFRGPAVMAVVALVLAAAAFWFVWLLAFTWVSRFGRLWVWAVRAFRTCVVVALLLVVVLFVVPLVAWATVRIQSGLALTLPQTGVGVGTTALLTYVSVLVSTLWRRRQKVGRPVERLRGAAAGRSQLTRAVPHGLTPHLTVWAVLLLLTVVSLLILGWVTATAHSWDPAWQLTVPLVFAVVVLSLDQTWMSLHPFYRSRLAAAFAVRRQTDPDGERIAVPYDFETEPTPLHWYGRKHPGFPQVIFAAAANLSGSDRTPPGRRAVSFTLSHDYVGGPDVGYVDTERLGERTKRLIRRDLTVQSAVAVSGAAFASAMGRQSRAYQTLFALSNARLGTWLPNPAALAALWGDERDWRLPPEPAIRRLPYLLREVFGRYPMDDRLLLTTDGGHYENLGLVELLRHGVRTAVCIDASGDHPPFAGTLGEAITLAREELGVEIRLDDWQDLVPGSAEPLQPEDPLARLNSRLSARVVVTGTIIYPRELVRNGQGCGTTGRLIVAKATLAREMPYELLAYASSDAVFPRDSTSDQWFDHRQFDAYRALGYFIGEQADKALRARLADEGSTATEGGSAAS